MEIGEEIPKEKKRKLNSDEDDNKKPRLFSAKEFRKQLKTTDKQTALKNFLQVLQTEKQHNYVAEYLKCGGNCLELLQILELDSAIAPHLIFNILHHVLLKIIAHHPQQQSASLEACQYLLKNYITVFNKMLNLSSSGQERHAALKLLTTLVTFSNLLAKDILLNITFHQTNLELVTKHTGTENSVRNDFIHFLIAFLVDGYYPTLALFLEKKGLLTSIVEGLKFDPADTVCLVLAAMKSHILENPLVSRSVKMHTFSTLVVRAIVNLYNWKGPDGFKLLKEKINGEFTVDEYEKSKVSECVHDFLLTLCTSHKFGVIFRDPSVGFNKKNSNSLMYTVIGSLDCPWEHSYAGQLLTEICISCPDLAKSMWNVVKPFLELRSTEKWLKAVQFSKELINKLQPSCVEVYLKEMSVYQMSQVIGVLVAPVPILKTIYAENVVFSQHSIKQNVVLVLKEMLVGINRFLIASKGWLNTSDWKKLKNIMSGYIMRNFPEGNSVLTGWETEGSNKKLGKITASEYLGVVFDIFGLYKDLCPQHLDNLTLTNLNLIELLKKVQTDKAEMDIHLKIIDTFLELDAGQFSFNSDLLPQVAPSLFQYYYQSQNAQCFQIMRKVLLNSGIFEGCTDEINIWINGILNVSKLDNDFLAILYKIFQETNENQLDLLKILTTDNEGPSFTLNSKEILESLMCSDDEEDVKPKTRAIHSILSPMVVQFLEYLETNENKAMIAYSHFVLLNLFHSQTDCRAFKVLLGRYNSFPKHLRQYIKAFIEGTEITPLGKVKNRLEVVSKYSECFLQGDIDDFAENLDWYNGLKMNLLQCGVFYVSHVISETVATNCEKFIKKNIEHFTDNDFNIIFCHPTLVNYFSILQLQKGNANSICTRFIINVVKMLKDCNLNSGLSLYREKLVKNLIHLLKKPKKYGEIEGLKEILQVFHLEDVHIRQIANYFNSPEENSTVFGIFVYCIEQFVKLTENTDILKPLPNEIVVNIVNYCTALNEKQEINTSSLCSALNNYLKVFPHQIDCIPNEFIKSIIKLNDFHKENVQLFTFLLSKNPSGMQESIASSLDVICEKKGLILPILDVVINRSEYDELLECVYKKIDGLITKTLQRPHKAGQYFINNYNGIAELVNKLMPFKQCMSYAEKVQKCEQSEVFHAKILENIYKRVLNETQINGKHVNNMILTFIHLEMNLFKRKLNSDEDLMKIREITTIFNTLLDVIETKELGDYDFKQIPASESFKTFCKFCLKYGVSKESSLLTILTKLIKFFSTWIQYEDAELILNMLLSHSEFLEQILDSKSVCKVDILLVMHTLFGKWSDLMERSHIPLLLASYNATICKSDRIVLSLLRMFESRADKTRFYDFKPFLWGQAAVNHYSVRSTIENTLWRQPKMSDVLDILQDDHIKSTILQYPLNNKLQSDDFNNEIQSAVIYDLAFLLPLFSQLLATENQVLTYLFTRSGALSLTVVGLSSFDKEIRQAACHVLSRFYFHLEGRHTGKDNLLWIRYVEAVCKGVAVLPDLRLNNFAAIYLSRMASILTQPIHDMYMPLSHHLTTKATLNLSTVPELYTFIHSADVKYREQRQFILEILFYGLRTQNDFNDFNKSMAFKLFSELFASRVSNVETKITILDILNAITQIQFGARVLYESYSILPQLYAILVGFESTERFGEFAGRLLGILRNLVRFLGKKEHCLFAVYQMLEVIADKGLFNGKNGKCLGVFYDTLYAIFQIKPEIIKEDFLKLLLERTNDKYCKYIVEYGCKYVDKSVDCLHAVFYEHFKAK